MKKLLFIILCLIVLQYANGQEKYLYSTEEIPPALQHIILSQQAKFINTTHSKTTKTTASGPVYDTSRWSHLVDSTWGNGIDDTAKLSMFNRIWSSFDSTYPCYVHLPLYNWDSIVNSMRAEITSGVSRGRYAAILAKLRWYINDGHTNFYDAGVNYPTYVYPGMPLMRGEAGTFGACITMLPDSTAMVYEVVPGHPFGLQPGDVILGYNSELWKDLIKIIQQHELPNAVYIGSTDAATYHRMIKSAGDNWHLFDTINIKKCDGTIVNFPTNLMVNKYYNGLCTEQMSLAGISKLTLSQYYNQGRSVSSGMMPGTKIGYAYMLDCTDASGNELYNAVKLLIEDSMANALIIDIRTNYGGGFNAYWKTFEYLMGGDVEWVGYGERVTHNNRYLMFNQPSYWYDIVDEDPHSFNNPIAILCGPEAVSAGDFFQLMYTHHPWVRTFGKSTAGAYGSSKQIITGQPNYYARMQPVNFYEVSNPGYYLTHTEYPIDQPVWFNRDSVCAGKDNIVGEAIQWINSKLAVSNINVQHIQPKIYPNPVADELHITGAGNATYIITNSFGQIIDKGIIDSNDYIISTSKYAKGLYNISLNSNGVAIHEKFVKND